MLGVCILAAALALKRVSDEIAYRATLDERRLRLHVSRAGRDDLTKREPAPQPHALRLHHAYGHLIVCGPRDFLTQALARFCTTCALDC